MASTASEGGSKAPGVQSPAPGGEKDSKAEKSLAEEDKVVELPHTPITFNCKNGKGPTLSDRNFAMTSKMVRTALENETEKEISSEMPVPGVTANIMTYVVQYMEHHKGKAMPIIEKPLRSKVMADVCSDKWDAKFIDDVDAANRQNLYDLILAANYLDIKCLLHLGCAKVASLIKGQPLEKIKEILDPKNAAMAATVAATATPAAAAAAAAPAATPAAAAAAAGPTPMQTNT